MLVMSIVLDIELSRGLRELVTMYLRREYNPGIFETKG